MENLILFTLAWSHDYDSARGKCNYCPLYKSFISYIITDGDKNRRNSIGNIISKQQNSLFCLSAVA